MRRARKPAGPRIDCQPFFANSKSDLPNSRPLPSFLRKKVPGKFLSHENFDLAGKAPHACMRTLYLPLALSPHIRDQRGVEGLEKFDQDKGQNLLYSVTCFMWPCSYPASSSSSAMWVRLWLQEEERRPQVAPSMSSPMSLGPTESSTGESSIFHRKKEKTTLNMYFKSPEIRIGTRKKMARDNLNVSWPMGMELILQVPS